MSDPEPTTGSGADLGVEQPAATDAPESRVQQAVRRLDGLDRRPVEQHVEVYEDVHADLRRMLDGKADGDGQSDSSGHADSGS